MVGSYQVAENCFLCKFCMNMMCDAFHQSLIPLELAIRTLCIYSQLLLAVIVDFYDKGFFLR